MSNGGKANPAPARRLWLSPGEFSAELAEVGLALCEKTIRVRCRLPIGHAQRIAAHPGYFPRRIYINRSELERLTAGVEVSA